MAGEAIFIGYRRDNTADVAGRIYDALEVRVGRERVFKDVDNIPPGVDFGNYIRTLLPSCRVALILIGHHWADARDGSGNRRLDDPNDWVRVEIETALVANDLLVVPVLVNGAPMPTVNELPPSLQPLLQRNAAEIRRDPDFRDDVGRLVKAILERLDMDSLDATRDRLRAKHTNEAEMGASPNPGENAGKAFARCVAVLASAALIIVFGPIVPLIMRRWALLCFSLLAIGVAVLWLMPLNSGADGSLSFVSRRRECQSGTFGQTSQPPSFF